MDKGRLYWITGLSGAGKTTIGTALYNKIREKKSNVCILDGDKLRDVYHGVFGYTESERRKDALCTAKLCNLFTAQGIDVICCTISMYDSVRDWNRANNEKYTEIYLKVTMETLVKRDKKGLYSSKADNVVGVNQSMEEPKHPDVLINNDGQEKVEDIVNKILATVES